MKMIHEEPLKLEERKLDEKSLFKWTWSLFISTITNSFALFCTMNVRNLMTTQNSTKWFVILSLLQSSRQGAVASIEMLMKIFKLLYTDDNFSLIKQDWVALDLIESLVEAVFGWTVKVILCYGGVEYQMSLHPTRQEEVNSISPLFTVWCLQDGIALSKW